MNQVNGDEFTLLLQSKILAEHARLLELVRKQRDAAIDIAETMLALYGKDDPAVGELNEQLQKLRGE